MVKINEVYIGTHSQRHFHTYMYKESAQPGKKERKKK